MSYLRHSDFNTSRTVPPRRPPTTTSVRQSRGLRAYHAGISAEKAVERHYVSRGYVLVARRCRNAGGELDLVLRHGQGLVFVEVKKARDFATAAARLSPRQIARLFQAAAVFLGAEPDGGLVDCRFDAALVDQRGEIEILENAMMGF